jgi:hypothetical protein
MKELAILTLVVLLIILIQNRVTSNFADVSDIPKTIWTYWDGPEPPDSVHKCMKTWRNYNPDYDIHLLSPQNLSEFLPGVDILGMKMANTPQRTSDLVRVHVLAEHGGVWCDSTIMMTGPIDFIHGHKGAELVGYHLSGWNIKKEWPVIENWFFACPPKSDFVSKWRDAFVKINDFDDPNKYVESLEKQGVNIDNIDDKGYLTMHVAAQYIIQTQMTPDEVAAKLKLHKAEDGPLKHMARNDWKSYEGVKSICSESASEISPIIKFRGGEREQIEKHGELGCVFNGHLN